VIIPGSDRFDLEKCGVKLIDTDPKADAQKLWMGGRNRKSPLITWN
jgi:hypothetical protein